MFWLTFVDLTIHYLLDLSDFFFFKGISFPSAVNKDVNYKDTEKLGSAQVLFCTQYIWL